MPDTPYYTDPQWQQLMGLQDLTGREQQIASQQAMANQLRQGGPEGLGRYSQAARALSGIGSAMLNYKAYKDQQQLSQDRKDWLAKMGPQQSKLPIAPPSVNNYNPSQFNDFSGSYGGGS